MTHRIEDLVSRIQALEAELETEIKHRATNLSHDFEEKRIRFEHEIMQQQKRFKMGLLKYLWSADIKSYIAASRFFPNVCSR